MSLYHSIVRNLLNNKNRKEKKDFSIFSHGEFSTAKNIRVKGLYLYGGSGSGKSFLSDIFYNNLKIE
jgi:predicted ATPase